MFEDAKEIFVVRRMPRAVPGAVSPAAARARSPFVPFFTAATSSLPSVVHRFTGRRLMSSRDM